MKKLLFLLAALALAAGFALPAAAATGPVSVASEAYVVMDADTGQVLLARNPDEELAPASVTKIMTLGLACEKAQGDWTVQLTVSHEDVHSLYGTDSSHVALQEGEVTRVGSDKPIQVNVRVIAATNKDLHREIEKGTFREDLFHRLNVIPIHVPALDDRKEDIPELVEFFTSQICEEQGWAVKHFTQDAIAALQQRHWPGNIRELRNVVERLIILSGTEISAADIENFA